MKNYLLQFREETPEWLRNFKAGDSVSFADFMSGRVGYYPGSGNDGNLVAIANKSHCVHAFLYVDYLIKREDLEAELARVNCFNGYHSIGRVEWTEKDLTPNGQHPFKIWRKPRIDPMYFVDRTITPYCFMEVFERNEDKDDSWGAERFAVTFLLADGIATYYQLFCCEYKKSPWLFLLQDHGFGCNYDCFGDGGVLDAVISYNNCYPEYVLCAYNTRIWHGYKMVEDVGPTYGGMHHFERRLYRCQREALEEEKRRRFRNALSNMGLLNPDA